MFLRHLIGTMKQRFSLLLLALLCAPAALLWLGVQVEAQDASPTRPGQMTGPQSVPQALPVLGGSPAQAPPFNALEEARQPAIQHQVRIRGRVVIRISPGPRRARSNMLNDLPRRPLRTSYAEVEHDDCIPARSVIGVQPSNDGRLLFFTNQDQVLAARLEDGCNARAFYAGFYTERNNDGQLCVNRNRLQSRAGAMCQVAEFTRLVAVAD